MPGSAVMVMLVSFAALLAAYFVYGRFLAAHIFQLDDNRQTPAHQLQDGVDYVPTSVPVLFGHHFASIAGLGPILGPAVAVIWGWVPAVVWIVVGCILLGAVHDLGTIAVSLRFQGRSIGDVCRELIGPRARLLFLAIVFFAMSLAMGAFVNGISSLFIGFNPDAIIPSLGLMLVAIVIGVAVYRYGVGLGPATVVGLLTFAGLIGWGVAQPVPTHEWFLAAETAQLLEAGKQDAGDETAPRLAAPYGANAAAAYLADARLTLSDTQREAAQADLESARQSARLSWIACLLAYGFVASVLPVWLLLQPRDYINSFQLYFALGALALGLVVATLTGAESAVIAAPAIRFDVEHSPPVFPFLFITIACGAVSGFHSLVSSGTTVRQIDKETDALPIGYGAMLTEGVLAVLVVMACVAGLGAAAWQEGGVYSDFAKVSNLGAQLNAVCRGGANFLASLGIPPRLGEGFLAVTVVAFALTTLDSATRLLRFNVEEICRSLNENWQPDRYSASIVAVLAIGTFGLMPHGATLWKMFGASNQLLAGLTLLAVSVFLFKLRRPVWYTAVPMAFMLCMTYWAMLAQLPDFLYNAKYSDVEKWLLVGTSCVLLLLTTWLIVEGALTFLAGPSDLDFGDGKKATDHDQAEAASHLHMG